MYIGGLPIPQQAQIVASVPAPPTGGGGGYTPATDSLLARFSGTYDTTRKDAINNLIAGLQGDGIWGLIDCLQIYAAPNSGDSLLNWKGNSYNGSLLNNPAFTPNIGWQTNGNPNAIDTGFNPSIGMPNYALNSATFGFYQRDSALGFNGCFNAAELSSDGTYLYPFSYRLQACINAASASSFDVSPENTPDLTGLLLGTRTSASVIRGGRNGDSSVSFNVASTAIPIGTFMLGCVRRFATIEGDYYAFFAPHQFSAFVAGAGMTAPQVTSFYNRLQAYLTVVGASV